MKKEISNSRRIEGLLRETGFKTLILFTIIIFVIIALAAPHSTLIPWFLSIVAFSLSVIGLYRPSWGAVCANFLLVCVGPLIVALVLTNGLVPATLFPISSIFVVMLGHGYWRIVPVLLNASATLLVPFSGIDYEPAIWVRLSVANFFVAAGAFFLASFLERALVESLDKADALKEALESERKANEVQSIFLASMSHEIRTPLNGIIGLVGIVLSSNITEVARPRLERVRRAGNALDTILSDILDHSKLKAGKLVFEYVPICIAQVISETKSLYQTAALDKDIQLITRVDESVDRSLMGDSTRMMQVLNNLVSNAIKFTENNGSVRISLKVTDSSETTQVLEFCVSDTGIGIPAESLNLIFSPFVQANKSTAREYGGTGLGLQISKSLVANMGGEMWVESEEGSGSQFYFRLALEKTQQPPLNLHHDSQIESPQFNGKVLLVEDNEINQIVAKEILKSYGLDIELAIDGMQAIELTKHSHFDLIFMDLQMPNVDGFEATKAIRLSGSATPIVALSASALKEDVEEAYRVGMNGHIAKPIHRREVIKVLRRFLKYG
ncbi:MAG: signal transduction histidine kinase [Arenicella sp.]